MAKRTAKVEERTSVVTDASLSFFEKYINNPSPTGFVRGGQRLWLEYIEPYVDGTYIDNYGSDVGIINSEAEYKVVIEAHADAISWFVNYISKDGLIYVIRNAGSDDQIAPSKRVTFHSDKG